MQRIDWWLPRGWGRRRIKKKCKRTSLAVQWLRPYTSSAGHTGSIPGQGTKIPCGTVKTKCRAMWYGQKNAGLQSHARVISYASKYLKIKKYKVTQMLNKITQMKVWMNICWTGNGLYKHDTGYLETWLPEHHSLPLCSQLQTVPFPSFGLIRP